MKLIARKPENAYIDSMLWVPKGSINVDATKSALSFVFTDNYTGAQRLLHLWKEATHHLLVPRAFWDAGTFPCPVIDCRPRSFQYFDFKSIIQLDHLPGMVNGVPGFVPTGNTVQRLSMSALTSSMGGVLQLACGKGKTVIALDHVARSQSPALIVVDNLNLLYQWEKEVNQFLTVPGGIGYMIGGKYDWKKAVVLATYQTIANAAEDMEEEARRWFRNVYFDEAHHVNAPTYSKAVSLFYGNRYGLTATPERDDGTHIICHFHVGPVLHKDLSQALKAENIFKWTGFQIDLTQPAVARAVLDVNGEMHTSKIPGFLGAWRERMWMIMQDAIDAVDLGRKVLVLSNSVDEVVNLMTMWTRGPQASLYTDIQMPTAAEVGETLTPVDLDDKKAEKLAKNITYVWQQAEQDWSRVNQQAANNWLLEWQHYLVHKKIVSEYERRQRDFLKALIDEPSTAGFMTYGVPPKVRQKMLNERPVTFAITKYGREGLDCTALDTVLVSTPFSKKGTLQQLMGRPTRPKAGKKKPIIVFYEDNVGPLIGMCQKLKKHLRSWPHDEGGPFDFELLGHPKVKQWKYPSLKLAFGQS